MDTDGHAQFSSENLVGFTPSHETGNDDAAEKSFFGPRVSPQNPLMQEISLAEDATPRRRSARLAQTSTPVRPLNLRITVPQVEETVEETDLGNDTAEINQDAEDEPSQVLAERVLSAVSNPSPPPDFLSFPDIRISTHSPPEPPEPQSDSNSATASPPDPVPGLSPDGEGAENALSDSVNHVPTPHTFDLSPSPPSSPPQHATPIEKPLVAESSASGILELPPLTSTAILSENPLIHLQTDEGERAFTALEKGKGREIVDDEARDQVAELPILEESPKKPSGRRRSARRSASPVKRRSTSPDGNRLQPPRRSVRLSVSPRRTPSPGPTLILPEISPLRLPTKDVRTQSDPPEIAALPTADGVGEKLMEAGMEEAKERASRKRKRQDDANKTTGRQRLGSLSPDSQSVLQQLFPPSRSGSDEDDKAKETASQQPLHGPQRILVSKPPTRSESPHIQTTNPQPHLGTPLRRVPASASTISGDGSSARRFGQTPFKVQSLDDPNRSPSRRVPVALPPSSGNRSVVPQPTVFSQQHPAPNSSSTLPNNSKPTVKQRSISEEPATSRQPPTRTNHYTTLPYPLTQKHPVIPEEIEETQTPPLPNNRASSEPPAILTNPIPRSTLRQPTTPSRIPRIGAKPYSRPPGVQPSKLPVLSTAKRTVPIPVGPHNRPESSRSASSSQPKHGPFVPVSSRKTFGPTSETTKPPAKRPIPTGRLPQLPAATEKLPPSHIPIKSPPPPQPLILPDIRPSTDSATETEHTKLGQERTYVPDPSSSPPEDQLTSETVPTSTHAEDEGTSVGRRTTRSRRGPSALLEETVFGAPSASPSRPPPKKRLPPDSSGFAGLSINALKNLTTDNTVKNQKVISLLETEIVRREGKRPESPAVKLRTVAEKEKEEKTKQREQRAQRRAKRSDGDELEPPDVNDLVQEEDGRHRRGAGEDEDYTTPERPMRPLKRLKADESEEVETAMAKERRVQWDRLLFSAVYIDEIPEKLSRPHDQGLGKGCLSQAAKSIELDRLGNVQDAGSPLPQVPAEKVVVKRYVYDDDDPPPESEGSGEPEPTPAKSTRSKGRKK